MKKWSRGAASNSEVSPGECPPEVRHYCEVEANAENSSPQGVFPEVDVGSGGRRAAVHTAVGDKRRPGQPPQIMTRNMLCRPTGGSPVVILGRHVRRLPRPHPFSPPVAQGGAHTPRRACGVARPAAPPAYPSRNGPRRPTSPSRHPADSASHLHNICS